MLVIMYTYMYMYIYTLHIELTSFMDAISDSLGGSVPSRITTWRVSVAWGMGHGAWGIGHTAYGVGRRAKGKGHRA